MATRPSCHVVSTVIRGLAIRTSQPPVDVNAVCVGTADAVSRPPPLVTNRCG